MATETPQDEAARIAVQRSAEWDDIAAETTGETRDRIYEVHGATSILVTVHPDGSYDVGAPGPADGGVLYSDAETGAYLQEPEELQEWVHDMPEDARWAGLGVLGAWETRVALIPRDGWQAAVDAIRNLIDGDEVSERAQELAVIADAFAEVARVLAEVTE